MTYSTFSPFGSSASGLLRIVRRAVLPYPPRVKLPPLPLAVFDTETTGFVPKLHKVIEFACMRADEGRVTGEYERLFGIEGDVPPHVEVLTRIKTPSLKDKAPMDDAARAEILERIGPDTLLVGQNLGFDLGMLKGEGIDLTDRPWIDTSLLAALAFPEMRSYSLMYVSRTLGLNHEPVHRALGDVRATLELLGQSWERLSNLPTEMRATAKAIMAKAPEGYRRLFAALPDGPAERPWIFPAREHGARADAGDPIALTPPDSGSIALREEELHARHLQRVIDAAAADTTRRSWVAVKNLEAAVRRLHLPDSARVIYPPWLMLDTEAVDRMRAQDALTAEEALLAVKIAWFSPKTRSDVSVHGGERDTWNGKLACTDASPAYLAQFQDLPRVLLIDHRQLLQFLAEEDSPARAAMETDAHVIIDDASMLEDTATKAYGYVIDFDDLRAAAQGDESLMRLVDTAFLWAERARRELDLAFLTRDDLSTRDTAGLAQEIRSILEGKTVSGRLAAQLQDLAHVLDPERVTENLVWIEKRMNGALSLQCAPEKIDALLHKTLFSRFPTTLIVPSGDGDFPELLPPRAPAARAAVDDPCAEGMAISFPSIGLRDILLDPPPGKTIILAGSKHMIEKLFVEHTERLEDAGVTLICQGMGGGMNRMEADFLAAAAPAIMIITPWMYEGSELPEGTVDHLVIDMLPFDNPGAPVFSKRKDHYKNGFDQYALPRLRHRLFRLLRTYCRHRTPEADVRVLDKRIGEKAYGKQVRAYLERFAGVDAPDEELRPASAAIKTPPAPAAPKPAQPKKAPKPKPEDDQMRLF